MPRKKTRSPEEAEQTTLFPEASERKRTPEKSTKKRGKKPSKKGGDASEPKFADEAQVEKVIQQSNRIFDEASNLGNSLSQYLKELRQYPVLSGPEELEIARRAAAGDADAQTMLVLSNLRFVVTIAKQYSNRGVPLQDLIAEGNTGLLKAVTKFNPDYGVKFISYAVHWIGQSIRAALASQQRSFRLPLNRATQLAHILRAQKALSEKRGRPATPAEIAKKTGINLAMVKTLLAVQQGDVSLDSNEYQDFGDNQGLPLSERLASETGTEETLERRFQTGAVNHALSFLRPRDEKIIRLFYGLDGGREHTLEEIGILLGITRERVRQLRDRALKELREKGYAEDLREE